jgi:hypothetical protein
MESAWGRCGATPSSIKPERSAYATVQAALTCGVKFAPNPCSSVQSNAVPTVA